MTMPTASRRQWLRLAASGVAVTSTSGWIEALAADAAAHPSRRRACILLWMNGGASQTDTFDPKSGHENAGPMNSIPTAVPGIRIGEHLPKMAKLMKDLAIVRSMSTKEGDHGRATYYLRTGYVPQGNVQHPPFGSLVAKEVPSLAPDLPSFVSIGPDRTQSPASYTPGFLGHDYAPLIVGEQRFGQTQANYEALLKVRDIESPAGVDRKRTDARLGLLGSLEDSFVAEHPGDSTESHRSAVDRAVKLTRSRSVRAFNLGEEPAALRDAYGRNTFGQGCLLARRLVERGVPFVEVTHAGAEGGNGAGWDTHFQGFDALPKLCGVLDAGWSTLIEDLRKRGLLDSTLIVWMGEFGRTPKINSFGGRDHFPTAWSAVLAGGGIAGGRVIGATTDDGLRVEERPVTVPDLVTTACMALGIDPRKQNMSNVGRPIRIADPAAKPLSEALS
jgi:Protein of unknown function (DUF1501)